MGEVIRLPEELRKRITAGEVIERPADVVKELVENSLDAQTKKVVVEVFKGGKELIRVEDWGKGIEPEDLPLVFEEFTTSKIRREEDLLSTLSYGFRGEGLHSIAQVSRVRIKSRHFNEELGRELMVEGGKVGEPRRVGMHVGTIVEVKDLFYNLPVRRKFLKRQDVENRKILELVKTYSLSNPEVSFELYLEGKESFKAYAKGEEERLEEVFKDKFEKVEKEKEQVKVRIYLSRNKRRGKIYLFINKRPVFLKNLSELLRRSFGYKTLVIAFLEVPPYLMDLNVHPKKREVKLYRERLITELLRGKREGETLTVALREKEFSYQTYPELVGILENTFIMAKYGGYLYFFDQHLLSERINYERGMDERESCLSSVRAGDKVSKRTAQELLKAWTNLENPHTCPHGRPLYWKIPLREIYERLGRKP